MESTTETCQEIARTCKDKTRKAKVKNEFHLMREVTDYWKRFHKYINVLARKEAMVPLLNS